LKRRYRINKGEEEVEGKCVKGEDEE